MRIFQFYFFVFLSFSGFTQINEIKVMSYNVLSTTSLVDNINVIQQTNADIIGLQEGYTKSASIASALGFYHYSDPAWSEAILSRFPITSTDWWGIEIELSPGQFIYVYNAHLSAYPYQPYDIRDGLITTPTQAINEALSARGSEISDVLTEMTPFIQAGYPVFLTGDFNEPSHLDWTANAANNGLHFGWEVEWPTSTMCLNAGLNDTYRTYFTDEVLFTGETWTPWLSINEVYDRIDIVYFVGNNVTVTNVEIVGPDVASSFVITPYESDHRAVLSTFNLLTTNLIEANKNEINIYPNPTSDLITLDINGYNGTVNIEVCDLQGRLLQTTNSTTISLKDYDKGVYVFRVSYRDRTEDMKVVKD